ncbi:MAG: hypothetical protein IJJ74_04490 [Eubacterium sp.]|nr:hypothetical protein [Eubacterium sp.]MBR1675108.1 hypothetical protein [Eubacterium sp.]
MHYVEAKTVLTPQNGYSPYHGSTEDSIYCEGLRKPYNKNDYFDVEIKKNAPDLLGNALAKKRTRGMVIVGSMVDPYMDVEKDECIMRDSLNVIARHDFGVSITTRNTLLLRDMDLLDAVNRNSKVIINVPFETLSDSISGRICVGASTASERMEMICELIRHKITVTLLLQPMIPCINDYPEEVSAILSEIKGLGISGIDSGNMLLTLRGEVGDHFHKSFKERFPSEYSEYLKKYGDKDVVISENAAAIEKLVRDYTDKYGIANGKAEIERLNRSYENKTEGIQMNIFDLI